MPLELQSTLKRSDELSLPEEKEVYKWSAPARPFKRRNREFYVSLISIAALFSLILFLIEGFLPVVLVVSLVFLFYVLSTIEPDNIDYKITNYGIRIHERLAPWQEMTRFWFVSRFGSELLIIETIRIPGRIEIIISPEDKPKIMALLNKKILHEEVP